MNKLLKLLPFGKYDYSTLEQDTPIKQRIKNWLHYRNYNFSSINKVFDKEMGTLKGIVCNRCGVKEYKEGTCFQYRHGFNKEWEDEFTLCSTCSKKLKLVIDEFKVI